MPTPIISLSGGKDSTAMYLKMLENGEDIKHVVFFDGGWEFPQMHEHLERLEEFTGIKIVRLRPRIVGPHEKEGFDHYFCEHVTRTGTQGYGWPSSLMRWCTRIKIEAIRTYMQYVSLRADTVLPLQNCVGFAIDEQERSAKYKQYLSEYIEARFPLIEYKMKEQDALEYCKTRGFTWGGLYNSFKRVSCYCCPLQRVGELKKLHANFPAQWSRMQKMESWLNDNKRLARYKEKSVAEYDRRFRIEEKQKMNLGSLL